MEGSFSTYNGAMLDGLFYHCGTVAAYIGNNPNVFEACHSIVNKEALGKARVEHGEVVVRTRDSLGDGRVGMEDLSINSFRGVGESLDSWDFPIEGDPKVGADLGVTPLVEVL